MLFIIWKGKGACKKSPIGIRTHDLQILTFALRCQVTMFWNKIFMNLYLIYFNVKCVTIWRFPYHFNLFIPCSYHAFTLVLTFICNIATDGKMAKCCKFYILSRHFFIIIERLCESNVRLWQDKIARKIIVPSEF